MPSFEKRASGLWTVRFRENGKNVRLSGYKTKKEAQWAYEDRKNGTDAIPQEQEPVKTFGMMYQWWKEWQKDRLKQSSFYDTTAIIEKNVLPFFRGKTEVNATDILEWQATVSGYSYNYRKTLQTRLQSILSWAKTYYGYPSATETAPKPRRSERKKEMSFYTPEQFRAFLHVLEGDTWICFFRLLYETGLRRGEALALNKCDIVGNYIEINKSISYKAGNDGNAWGIVDTKNTSSHRKVYITDNLAESLNALPDGSFLFGGDRPLPLSTITRRLNDAQEKAGLPKIRLHDFRHSFASNMISGGIPIPMVSKMLGHANVTQTLDTYAHIIPDDRERAEKLIQKISYPFSTQSQEKER